MPFEFINGSVLSREKDIRQGIVTVDAVLDDVYSVCFGKSKVPEAEFLEMLHKYDPNFGPINSEEKRKARAELTRKVREGFRAQLNRQINSVAPEVRKEYAEKYGTDHMPRQFFLFFRNCKTVEEQKELANRLGRDGGNEISKIFAERVLSKTDELLSLRYLNDEELVEKYFQNKDLLDMAFEMEKFNSPDFTKEQQENYDRLLNNMAALKNLTLRLDTVANNYYADYPIEQFELQAEDIAFFEGDMRNLCLQHGESTGNHINGKQMPMGPVYDFTTAIYTLCGIRLLGTLDQSLTDFVGGYGAKNTESCVWTTADGKEDLFCNAMEALNRHELLFVDIPGKGIKALRNGNRGNLQAKPELAGDADIHAHMLRAVEEGVKRVDEANPSFLAKYTGSQEYNDMAGQHKAVRDMAKSLKFPLGENEYRKAQTAVAELKAATDKYLEYKKKQGLKEDKDGALIGRSANERKRLAAAREAVKLGETLDFLLRYQKEPEMLSETVQQKKAIREGKYKPKAVPTEAPKYYEENERSSVRKEDMEAEVQKYAKVPPVQPSTAGSAMVKLQEKLPGAVREIVNVLGVEKMLGDVHRDNVQENMARLVLFDYILKERAIYNKPEKKGEITAGPVEKAFNEGDLTPSSLARTPGFREVLGKFTPARLEAFLKGDESRKGLFNIAVMKAATPARMNPQTMQAGKMSEKQPAKQQALPRQAKPSGRSMNGI